MANEAELKRNIAKNLLRLRRAAGLSQMKLSSKAGLAASYISHLENERRIPHLLNAVQIADALGCSLDDLVRNVVEILPEQSENSTA